MDLNTQFGAYYFKYWQDRLDGLPALAAAAYNAGPGRAQAWRPSVTPLEGAIWVETIPFNETRDYVKKVLANAMIYTHALDRPYAAALRAARHHRAEGRERRQRGYRRHGSRRASGVMARLHHVLVLGGTGFVGRHLIPRLSAAGHRVTVIARRRHEARHLILLPTVQVVEGDPLDPRELDVRMRGVTAVVNLSASSTSTGAKRSHRCTSRARARSSTPARAPASRASCT